MKRVLEPERRAAIAERLRFYRDLGVYDFYRRAVPPDASEIGVAEDAPGEPAQAFENEGPPANASSWDETAASESMKKTVFPAKPAALADIREDLGDCKRCPLHRLGRKQIVFGVGNPDAELMFVGEGPGADEDAQGEPFVGRAGQLLNNMISAMGLRREDIYIANVVKCRPPQNRTPEREECETCSPFLMRQIAVVRPKIIVALGAVAAKTLLGINDSMAKLRGRIYDFSPALPKDAPERDAPAAGAVNTADPKSHSIARGYSGAEFSTKLAVTYHPAYLLRDPRQKKEAWQDLQMVMRYLGLTAPGRSGGQG